MARIKKLKDNTDSVIYPITVLAAIYKDENQTVEEWLEGLLEKMKDASSTLDATLAAFQQTSQEKLNYYDNLANEALSGVDGELQAILTDVESHATTKKEEITTLIDTEKSNITTLSTNSQSEITTLTDTEKSEITTLSTNSQSEITTLTNDKKSSITTTATNATNDFNTLNNQLVSNFRATYNEKNSQFDAIISDFQTKANEALDGEHITKQVTSELGIHGLRFYNDILSYKNASNEWVEISAGGFTVGTTAPEKTNLLWINSTDNTLNYYNTSTSTWTAITAVWG